MYTYFCIFSTDISAKELVADRGRLREVHISYMSVLGTFRISNDMKSVACAAGIWDAHYKILSEKELKIQRNC